MSASAAGFATAMQRIQLPVAPPLIFALVPAPIVEQVTVVSASRQEELRDGLLTSTGSAATLYRLDVGRTARVGVRLAWTR